MWKVRNIPSPSTKPFAGTYPLPTHGHCILAIPPLLLHAHVLFTIQDLMIPFVRGRSGGLVNSLRGARLWQWRKHTPPVGRVEVKPVASEDVAATNRVREYDQIEAATEE